MKVNSNNSYMCESCEKFSYCDCFWDDECEEFKMKRQTYQEKLDIYEMKLGRALTVEELERFEAVYLDDRSEDITFCASETCPQKDSCLRYAKRNFGLTKFNVYSMAYFHKEGEACENFIDF